MSNQMSATDLGTARSEAKTSRCSTGAAGGCRSERHGRAPVGWILLVCLTGWPVGIWAQTQPLLSEGYEPQAPPPAWPTVTRSHTPRPPAIQPQGATRYSIGDPTGEEQFYLELINRARANPPAEGVRLAEAGAEFPEVQSSYDYFGVDLNQMVSEFAAILPAAPLSFNERLLEAARLHSQDMFTNAFQGHYSWNPTTDSPDFSKNPGFRLDQVNYPWNRYGENVYSAADYPFYGHAGFEVDWGFGTYGMQGPPRGHRDSIHNPDFREVGIGVVNGSHELNGREVGPQLVTQDFGSQFNLDPFVTGVVYYDLNGNQFYDAGEGLEGATVEVASSQFHAVTASSGGYSVPVPPNANHSVTFSAPGFAQETQIVAVGTENVKVDFRRSYNPPVVSGPSQLGVGQAGSFTFSSVGGSTGYRWSYALLSPHLSVEGAEDGTAHLEIVVTPGYSVIDLSQKASGTASFHLAMPKAEAQTLDLNQKLRPGPQAQLRFASRLGWATAVQVARVQVSEDGGARWSDVWSRPGTGNAGQASFEPVTVPLTDFSGQVIRVRFRYTYHASEPYFGGADSGVGWNLDDIRFEDVDRLEQGDWQELVDPHFEFGASTEGTYRLEVQPRVSGLWFPPSPENLVEVSGTAPPMVTIEPIVQTPGGGLSIECIVANGPPSAVRLEFLDQLSSEWSEDTAAQVREIETGVRFGFDVSMGPAGQRFYRVVIDP